MAAARTLQRLHQLIWVLIYGGVLTLILGAATARNSDGALGWSLIAGGGVAAAAGLVLIGVRSRLRAEPAP